MRNQAIRCRKIYHIAKFFSVQVLDINHSDSNVVTATPSAYQTCAAHSTTPLISLCQSSHCSSCSSRPSIFTTYFPAKQTVFKVPGHLLFETSFDTLQRTLRSHPRIHSSRSLNAIILSMSSPSLRSFKGRSQSVTDRRKTPNPSLSLTRTAIASLQLFFSASSRAERTSRPTLIHFPRN